MTSRNRLGKKLNGSRCSAARLAVASFRASGGEALNCSGLRSMECIELRKLNDRLALRKRRINPKNRSDRWHKIGGFQRTIDNDTLADAGAHGHHPRRARERIARAVML